MWVELSPRPPDFCGRPPCPRCYRWQDGNEAPVSGLHKMSLDLLGLPLAKATSAQRAELRAIGKKLHDGGLGVSTPTDDPPPEPVDIGMSTSRWLEASMRLNRPAKPVAQRELTCDEVAARQAARDERKAAEKKERDKRLKEIREAATVFQEATQGAERERREREAYFLRGVDPRFVEYCRQRGITNPEEIRYRAEQEYAMVREKRPDFDMDPRRGIGPPYL